MPSPSPTTRPTGPPTSERVADRAGALLRTLTGDDAATFRRGQLEAIEALVTDRGRVLVVERTGWGKSAVYFIATRLLRDAGAGATLLVSPLLALMRDQIAAAGRMGLRAATVNSTNVDDWANVEQRVHAGEIDLLLVSPERINHPRFRREVLPRLVDDCGLLVVDEAHCISDWGHDFRPDYRRIRNVLARLEQDRSQAVPVLACTATANDRVVADVAAQLATGTSREVRTIRGPLGRDSLRLAVVDLRQAEERLAWLVAFTRERRRASGHAGIVYTLTVDDAEHTAAFLAEAGVDAHAYSSRVAPDERTQIEDRLANDDLDVVVATTALSMGYDKPDLSFVVHLGAPGSPVAYYQAIGRAGRSLDEASVVLLPTGKDEAIWHHFDLAGVPVSDEVDEVLAALDGDEPTSLPRLEPRVNVRRSRLELLLKILDVDGAVAREGSGWVATGAGWQEDRDRYARLLAARRAEHEVMRAYAAPAFAGCRMQFLTGQLDDPHATPCGRCDGCGAEVPGVDVAVDEALVARARRSLRGRDVLLRPRRRWPSGLDALGHPDVRGNLGGDERHEMGRALAGGDDSGWGAAVARLLENGPDDTAALDEVTEGLVDVLKRWDWRARPTSIVPIPSRTRPALLAAVCDRLGDLGRLPVVEAVRRAADTPGQSAMANSAHAAANALRAYAVDPGAAAAMPAGPVLLVDLTTDSGWTLTAVTHRLRQVHPDPVLPLVLRTAR